MKPWTTGAISMLLVTAACSAEPPAKPQSQPAPAPTTVAEPAPKSEGIARADALLEDFRRREAAQAKYDRENPPPAFIPIPRSSPASAPAESTASPQPAPAPAPAAPTVAADTAPARDEMSWKRQMQSLQMALDEASAKLAEAEKLNFKNGYNDAQAEYKRRLAAVATARQAVERLRDEARRAGVPPAWLRP